jgi:hypothetical protein
MTRIVTSGNATELARPAIVMSVLVDLDFAGGRVYFCDYASNLVWGGNTFLGFGQYGTIDAVQEEVDVIARPLQLTLSGVDNSLVATARDEVYQGRSIIVYLGMIDATTGSLLQTPETVWEGRMDTLTIQLGEKTGSITLNCEHRLQREPRVARYTNPDQQLAYSGDVFFEFTAAIPGYVSQWGQERASYGGGGSGNGRTPGAPRAKP